MKRSFFALMTALMMLVLTACGGNTTPLENQAGDDDTANITVNDTTNDTGNAAVDNNDVSDNSTNDNASEADDDAITDTVSITRGVWTDKTYTNPSIALTFTAPDGWVTATDEELAELVGLGADAMEMGTEAYEQAIAGTLYDMGVSDPINGNNIMICFENVSETAALFSDNLTAEDYIDILKAQLSEISDPAYSFPTDIVALEICGNEYLCLSTTATSQGIELTQHYVVRRQGDHMISLIFTSVNYTLEDFLSCFG